MSLPSKTTPAELPPVDPSLADAGIDGLYGHTLKGWVRTRVLPALPAEIQVYADGEFVLAARAQKERIDIVDAKGRAAAVDFEVRLPGSLFTDAQRVITLQFQGTELTGSQTELNFPLSVNVERVLPVMGHADAMRGLFVTGWALDPENPTAPVTVELMCDDQTVARSTANKFRADLAKLQFAEGYCAYTLRLPPEVFDGKAHKLSVRETITGTTLAGPAITLPDLVIEGKIEGLNGAGFAGWVHVQGKEARHALDLWIDNELASSGEAASPREHNAPGQRFFLGVPDRFLDGRPHEVSVTLRQHPGRVVDMGVFMLLSQLTPSDALQRYAGTRYLRSYLSPLGPQRYESLRRGLSQLSDAALSADSPEALAELKQAVLNMALGQEQVIRGFTAPLQTYDPIIFPVWEAPKVSIVIPVHNKFATTYTCLASLAAAQCRASYEVIVVDDGSSDETEDIQTLVQNITVVRHEVAQGFVGASNAGGEAARGEYVVMLNNDTEVMSGWLDELLDPFERFDNVGMTGAKLIYPSGDLQEAGGLVWGNGQPWNIGRNGNPAEPRYNYVRQVDYLSGACVMLPMPLWKELKGFDTYYAPAYYEDTDLAFRVRAKGFKTVYTPFCEVVHYEGVSNGTSTSGGGLKRFQAINKPKFLRRWAEAYQHNGVNGHDKPHLLQDRGVRFRALVLDAQTLMPDQDAGSYAALQEIRILQSLGCKVTFVPSNIAFMGGYTEQLQRMGVEMLYAPFCYSMAEVIEKRGSEFDFFYIARYGVAEQVVDKIRSLYPEAKIILNIHDLHFLRELREAIHDQDGHKMGRALLTRESELKVISKVDLALSYSEVEQAVITSHSTATDATPTGACPWVVETAQDIPPFETRQGIAFLGGFAHRPNIEAVEWFVREVMPLLRERLPGVPFFIYGSKAPDSFKKLESEDVILKGFVKTTDEVYDTARVFVAPLLTGAGLKGKVIGAFSRGIPTVMTPTAAEGTGARHGDQAMVCSEPAQWVEHIAEIYESQERWEAMSVACRRLTQDQYSFDHGREVLADALRQIGIFPPAKPQSLWPRLLDGSPVEAINKAVK